MVIEGGSSFHALIVRGKNELLWTSSLEDGTSNW